MNKTLINKMKKIEKEISKEKGHNIFFALFLPEDSIKWDLIITSSWIKKNKIEAIKYISLKIKNALTKDELSQISHIVPIDDENINYNIIKKTFCINGNGIIELRNCYILNVFIKHAYVFKCA